MEFYVSTPDLFRQSSPSSEDVFSLSEAILHSLQKYLENRTLDGEVITSLVNTMSWLLQNLPPITNNKTPITRNRNWAMKTRAEQKRIAIEGSVNAVDRILPEIPPLKDDDGKQLITRQRSWEPDTSTALGSDDGDKTQNEGGQETRESQNGYTSKLIHMSLY